MTTPRTDYVARAPSRFLEQFRNKTKLAGVLKSYETQLQNLENAAWEVILYRTLNINPDTGTAYAVGVQLDAIGRIVGRPRQGLSDSDYLIAIRGQIRINRSCGRPDDIIEVAILSLPTGYTFDYSELYPAVIYVSITSQVLFTITVLFQNLVRTKSGAVRLLLEYSSDSAEEWMTFADNDTEQASQSNGFPDCVTLAIDTALGAPDTLFYCPDHKLETGLQVLAQDAGVGFPTGFAAGYYSVIFVDADHIRLELTPGSGAIIYTTNVAFKIRVPNGTKSRVVVTPPTVGLSDWGVPLYPFAEDEAVILTTTGTLPAPFQPNTIYYVGVDDGDNLLLGEDTGSFVTVTANGTGTHTITSLLNGGRMVSVLDSSVYV